ncbi:MAG: Gfo/Idh/MocA family oxidoreductase [Firmicutes bacterium]|nr:Gfo/Idh/MocA family oxidoreductase [Bacillota bacterium]
MTNKPVSVALVGIGGFARNYLEVFLDRMKPGEMEFVAVIDPVADRSPRYQEILNRHIPVYNTLEEFYAEHMAELVVISSPVQFHKEQVLTAFEHGSHVLSEKPLTVFAEDVALLHNEARKRGLLLAVGFQWSFTPRMLAFKKDILRGRFGKPLESRALAVWQRGTGYFQGWHGHLKDNQGNLLMDTMATNAEAHYLHAGLFLLGDAIDTARMPERVKASLYAAKPEPYFDTCYIDCDLGGGLHHKAYLSIAGDTEHMLQIEIRFENAVATLFSSAVDDGQHLQVCMNDGTVIDYDELCGSDGNVTENKFRQVLAALRNPEVTVTCQAATTLPFATICNSLFACVPVHPVPAEYLYEQKESPRDGLFIRNLYEDFRACYLDGSSPYEKGLPWAVPDTAYTLLTPHDYKLALEEKFR